MSFARSLLPLALVIALAACSPAADKAAPAAEGAPTQTAAAPAAPCDTPAVDLAVGASVSGTLHAAASYPANATYYCVRVAEGTPRITLTLSGLTNDLDLYIGHGSIQSVQGIDLQAGETYEWKSNAFGTDNEQITIDNPQAGVYYAEIVSYEGKESNYQFAVQ